jgi:hypothetical protein
MRTCLPGGSSLIRVGTIALALIFTACATDPVSNNIRGQHHCESFFVYSVCVADEDSDGRVDYMYFGDDLQVFMYDDAQEASLRARHPFHACAVPMGDSTRSLSSQLLYGDDLGFTKRLELKGALIGNYRAAQPAVEACNEALGNGGPLPLEDPFDVGEDWDEDGF